MAVTVTYSREAIQVEFEANSFTEDDQSLSNVVGLEGGGYGLIYNDDSDGYGIGFYLSPTSTGVSFGFGGGTDLQGEPVLTRLSNGNVAAVWKEGAGGTNSIRATIFDAETGTAGVPATITNFAANTDPEVAALANGNFVVACSYGSGVIAFICSPTAVTLAGFVVEDGASDPAVVGLTGGRFAVTYVEGGEVKARLYEADGTAVSGVGEITIGSGDASSPQMAALKNGGFAVIYDDDSFDGTPGLGMRLFDADGNDQSPGGVPIRVDLNIADDETDPEITVLENGFILVTYTRAFSATDDDIQGRIFDQSGTLLTVDGGSGFTVDNANHIDETQSSVAALGSGRFVTTWTDAESDGSGSRISARVDELVRTSTGDGNGDIIEDSDALRDIMYGGGGDDTLHGRGGRDDLFGGADSDSVVVEEGDVAAGETYDGGDDYDYLIVRGTGASVLDFRNVSLVSLEEIFFSTMFGGGATSHFNAAQLTQFAVVNFSLVGNGPRIVSLFMDTEITLDLSGLTLAGSPGAGDGFKVTGDGAPETITGTALADTLDGGGGGDTLFGGGGSDTYFADVFNEIITETNASLATGGDDLVNYSGATGTFVLSANVERLTLTHASANTGGTGNGSANTIKGNAGANALSGLGSSDTLEGNGGNDNLDGGTGADTMRGGADNDTYTVDDPGDVADETGGSGTDLVNASVSFTLGAGVDNLTLVGGGGINGTGNGLANTIKGNAGGNTLSGFGNNDTLEGNGGNDNLDGGAGADTMRGGGENDTYVVDDPGDVVDETGGSGTDLVNASVSFTLGAEVENLTLTGGGGINGTGNSLANIITGNGAANRINGGAGIDTLTGGAGPDTFRFDAAVTAKTVAATALNADIITDFNPAEDTIELAASVFSTLKAGALKKKTFDSGKAKPAKDKHAVYYQEKTGELWYDENGKKKGGKGDVLIATLDPGLDLTAADIVVA